MVFHLSQFTTECNTYQLSELTSLKQILEAGARHIKVDDWTRVKETVARHPETLQDKELVKKVVSAAIHRKDFVTVKDIVADPRVGNLGIKVAVNELNLYKSIGRRRNKILKFLERVSAIANAIRDSDEAKAEEMVATFDWDLDHSGKHTCQLP